MTEAIPLPFTQGDPVPWFIAPTASNPRFVFSSLGGRYVLLILAGRMGEPAAAAAMEAVRARAALFDDVRACVFTVSIDPADLAGRHVFDDRSLEVSRKYGAIEGDTYRTFALLLDPGLRVIQAAWLPRIATLLDRLEAMGAPDAHAGVPLHAPVLTIPRVFEADFCRTLVMTWRAEGGRESGFMREIDGRTVEVLDRAFKRRQDHELTNEALMEAARARITRRLVPEIAKAFQFKATRMERYLVARYGAGEGHFRAHRDNTTKGTAHRRFAVSINLDADAHQGGDLRFPEFGQRAYRPPTGGAVVFGCDLLHEVLPVTHGERFAFLPFLYDEEAAALRDRNRKFIGGETTAPRG